ncbi:arylamine N-acetyltransferase family protein [Streptomyces orinoci]|uniref:Arylamine N-acetyltransferase n=1 Tax=Streptomyces orinoci TaxID=67339 RepID=A0ABV3JTF4_STRON|nr:arylamine N-acetyltransferase [Streptomyces orinoci]
MNQAAATRIWDGHRLDLDAYLDRIGYTGERAPTLEALRRLQRAHVTSIPFENLDVILGIPVELDLAAVQDKLVHRRRGGYCFEHAVLFAAALERFGFEFTGLIGRVTLGAEKVLPATHALMGVRADGDPRLWLCDVGFGRGPLEPVEITDGAEADFDGWRFRMERREGALGVDEWWLHQYGADGWVDRHTFTLHPSHPIDYVVANHYVSTHQRSPFVKRPFAQRFGVTEHHRLDATALDTFGPQELLAQRKIEPAELGTVLAETFGIELSGEQLAHLAAGLDSA